MLYRKLIDGYLLLYFLNENIVLEKCLYHYWHHGSTLSKRIIIVSSDREKTESLISFLTDSTIVGECKFLHLHTASGFCKCNAKE